MGASHPRSRTLGRPRWDGRWPRWLRDIDLSLAVRSQFVLWGNVRDVFLIPSEAGEVQRDREMRQLCPLVDCLWRALARSGYECVIVYDPVDGVSVHPETEEACRVATGLLGIDFGESQPPPSLERLRQYLAAVAGGADRRAALVVALASRLIEDPRTLSEEQRRFFAFCQKLAYTAVPVRAGGERPEPLYNPVVWLLDRERDFPDWFVAGNETIRNQALPLPDYEDREETAALLGPSFHDYANFEEERREHLIATFAGLTEGMTLAAMIEVTRLARDQGLPFSEIADAVRCHKVGILESPWRRDDLRARLAREEENIGERVRGQSHAITKTLDILKRSVMGLSGAQTSASSTRPRGVLFFAGPTGVGKTELAKAVTQLVFGDERAYIRFDMSEFRAEHADARLIGAPPGYIGYDAGGELTNAVRQRPFSLILFDEIDKAHERLLDKFLQILDEGRLTDGRGSTVHFTESIIVFTTNLGIIVEDEFGGKKAIVTPEDPYEKVERSVREAVGDHFKLKLSRPELLNRLGENIVVFDFIRPQVAKEIFDLLLQGIVKRVWAEHKVTLDIPDDVCATLLDWCTADLSNGGRGIGNVLEVTLVNPLARALFPRGLEPGETIAVRRIVQDGAAYAVELA